MNRPAVTGLHRHLAAQLRPLVLLTFAIVTFTAPIAYLAMGTTNAREEAHSVARLIARSMLVEVRQRPALWRYDAAKLRRHLDAHLDPAHTARIVVTDSEGFLIEARDDVADVVRPLWGIATVDVGDTVIRVWVCTSTRDVLERSAWMLLGFAGLGTVMAGALYFVPIRAMGRAQRELDDVFDQLEASRSQLAALNTTLEAQVRERSAELERALATLEHKEQRLRTISRRATAAAEAERRALSRDLHDSAGQVLTAIRIHLQRLAQASHDPQTLAIAEQTMALADQAVEEIRRSVTRLAPAIVDDMGLRHAITRLCEDWTERTGILASCTLTGLDIDANLETGLEVACYRVVQECLTNVAKHAAATRVTADLTIAADEIVVRVHDDGRGFDPDQKLEGRGLAGMAERVALLGGELDIDSHPGHGTRITVTLPCDPAPPAVLP